MLLVVVLLLYAAHEAKLGHPAGLPTKWLGFSIMTGLVFLNAFRSYRAHWGRRKFWALLAPFSVLHFGVGLVVVSRFGRVGLLDFAFATLLEYLALSTYLNHFLQRGGRAAHREADRGSRSGAG
jgi:hypothetical protein